MTTRHYRSEDGITEYQAGDLLIDDTTGERSRVVRDGRGLVLVPDALPTTPTATTSRYNLRTVSVDSPLLTAYESGQARYLQGRPLPAGASRELTAGYYAAEREAIGLSDADDADSTPDDEV